MIGFENATDLLRLFEIIECVPPELRPLDPTLDALAQEGLDIEERLRCWQQESHWDGLPADCFSQLATTIHRALLLFHCRNFTFYSCWMTRRIPQLNQSEVGKHVSTILNLSQSLLSDTDIPAVLLLFPLRMAGVHVHEDCPQDGVLDIICKIRQKGFIVSDRIEVDLQDFWYHERNQLIKSDRMRV